MFAEGGIGTPADRRTGDSRACVEYSWRQDLFRSTVIYRLDEDELQFTSKFDRATIPYRDIASAQSVPVMGPRRKSMRRCYLRTKRKTYRIQSAHVSGWGRVEDQTAAYEAFIAELAERIQRANPKALFLEGMSFGTWLGWVFALAVGLVTAVAGLCVAFVGWDNGFMPVVVGFGMIVGAAIMMGQGHSRRVSWRQIARNQSR